MIGGAEFRLLWVLGGLLALGADASAAPALGAAPARAGFGAPAPRMAPPGRMLARQDRAFRPGHGYRRHVGYGGYGFYDASSYPQLLLIAPEARDEPEKEAIPVVVGIRRPPAADPVLYRIEHERGRPVARTIRFGEKGPELVAGGARLIEVKRR